MHHTQLEGQTLGQTCLSGCCPTATVLIMHCHVRTTAAEPMRTTPTHRLAW
jgi:hypothetical protein